MLCCLKPCIAMMRHGIDTVEVNGSSPFGPTISFNNLQTGMHRTRGKFNTQFNTDTSIWPMRVALPLVERGDWFQRVDGFALGFHTDMAVVLHHSSRDVSGNAQDCGLASACLKQLGNALMSEVVKPQPLQASSLGQ